MKDTETGTVTQPGEDIMMAFRDIQDRLAALGSRSGTRHEAFMRNTTEEWREWNRTREEQGGKPVPFEESTSLPEDTWQFGMHELYSERVYDGMSGEFFDCPRQRMLLLTTDFESFARRAAGYSSHMLKAEEVYEDLRERTTEALRDIFRERPDLDKVDIFLRTWPSAIMGVGAVRDREGQVEDVLVHFYNEGGALSVTPSCRCLLDYDLLYRVYDSVRSALGIGFRKDLYDLASLAGMEWSEERNILYGAYGKEVQA